MCPYKRILSRLKTYETSCNALSVLYDACNLLSGKYYQTLSVAYIMTLGLCHALSISSKGPQAAIENKIKSYFLDAFSYHFDQKLSADQKHGMLVCFFCIFLNIKFFHKAAPTTI
jgi:hypothetical protein